ncbi:MAG: hypothetical protein H6807_07445 [Planctomycetes bacterium]|nr:hypothetical protein [Planctomycetota bacterium]
MKSSQRILALLAVLGLVAVAACSSGNRSGQDGNGRAAVRGDAPPAEDRVASNPPAKHNRIRNCRVISYDPRTQATIVLVNAAHAWRETEQGQLNITNGQRNLTYKVLTDLQLDSLLETFSQRGADGLRENWDDRHAALLSRRAGEGDGFKGLIILENDGQRFSYIARKPAGPSDTLGVARYKIYSDMRQAVLLWERSGITEQVGMAAPGTSAPDALGMPASNRR